MKKSLIAGASVFALMTGLNATAWADGLDLPGPNDDDGNYAVSINQKNQTVTNHATVGNVADKQTEANQNEGIAGGAEYSLNNDFGNETYENQVINQNNINSGINNAQQGDNAVAIAVDQDGTYDDPAETNLAVAGNVDTQDVENTATVAAHDDPDPDGDEEDGIAGEANYSLNNAFKDSTFDNQVMNQNNINSGINSAQQGGNAAAIAIDLDGGGDPVSVNKAIAGNDLTQGNEGPVINSARVIDGDEGGPQDTDGKAESNDGIAGEVTHSLNNNFGNWTFNDQIINQNNINSGINSAQQGANTVAVAASFGPCHRSQKHGVNCQ